MLGSDGVELASGGIALWPGGAELCAGGASALGMVHQPSTQSLPATQSVGTVQCCNQLVLVSASESPLVA
jgi:hypothetical protein